MGTQGPVLILWIRHSSVSLVSRKNIRIGGNCKSKLLFSWFRLRLWKEHRWTSFLFCFSSDILQSYKTSNNKLSLLSVLLILASNPFFYFLWSVLRMVNCIQGGGGGWQLNLNYTFMYTIHFESEVYILSIKTCYYLGELNLYRPKFSFNQWVRITFSSLLRS